LRSAEVVLSVKEELTEVYWLPEMVSTELTVSVTPLLL
jgi:hypothetical protein